MHSGFQCVSTCPSLRGAGRNGHYYLFFGRKVVVKSFPLFIRWCQKYGFRQPMQYVSNLVRLVHWQHAHYDYQHRRHHWDEHIAYSGYNNAESMLSIIAISTRNACSEYSCFPPTRPNSRACKHRFLCPETFVYVLLLEWRTSDWWLVCKWTLYLASTLLCARDTKYSCPSLNYKSRIFYIKLLCWKEQ